MNRQKIKSPLAKVFVSNPSFDPHGIKYELFSWDMYEKSAAYLTRLILDDHSTTKQHYDGVIVPLRGGLWPGEVIASNLKIPIIPIGIALYDKNFAKGEAKSLTPTVYYDFPVTLKSNGQYLIVDDVNDTSKTYEFIISHLYQKFRVPEKNVTYAVIHEKPLSCTKRAHYHVRETDAWIIYAPEASPKPIILDKPFLPRKKLSDKTNSKLDYKSWEFFEKQYSSWMSHTGDTIEQCDKRAEKIGFSKSQRPSLQDVEFVKRVSNHVL